MKFSVIYLLICATIVSCSFSQKIKDGETAYERKQYSVALDLLEAEYTDAKNESVQGRKSFLIGKCLIRLQEYQDASVWFKKSVDHKYGAEALGNLANTYKTLEQYEAAIDYYTKLGESTGRIQEANSQILICKQAIAFRSKPAEYKITKLYENSVTSDYAPTLYEKDFLVFTSERKEATGNGVYNWTGERFSDLFVMIKGGSEVKNFDSAINSAQNEGAACFSKDLERMVFTRCYSFGTGDDFCKLMISNRDNGIWGDPEVLPFVQDKVNYGQATWIENDSVLVFCSNLEAETSGFDLYYSEFSADGSWSQPERFPDVVNSQGNEMFPTGDGDTLYFSSDYLPGLGGYDIFKTYLRNDRTWAPPYNIGAPINSGGDDFSFVVDYFANKLPDVVQQGYFSSSRLGAGKDDIYKFSKKYIAPEPIQTIDTIEKPKNVYVTIQTKVNVYNEIDNPNSGVLNKASIPDTYIKIVGQNNEKILEGYSDRNGFYYTEIPIDKLMKVIGSKVSYLNASKEVDSRNLNFKKGESSYTINIELLMEKIYTDKEINLANIYYDYDKWNIKNEAKPTLDQLVTILNDNPQINIQLSSHTDCRGTQEYNVELSQKRAQSVVDYLISKSISSSRLIAKGYGASLLVDMCECTKCSEAQHQINRRTTFKILKR